jgi:hypothetical protein
VEIATPFRHKLGKRPCTRRQHETLSLRGNEGSTSNNRGARTAQGCAAIFDHAKRLKMKQSENHVFVFPTAKIPGKAFFEIPMRRLAQTALVRIVMWARRAASV